MDTNKRLDLLAYHRSKLSPEHLAKPDTNPKKRQERSNRKKNSAASQVDRVIAQLKQEGYSKLADYIHWQAKLGVTSFDTQAGVRAAQLLLAGQHEQASVILLSRTGLFEAEKIDPPIKHTPYRESSGIEYRPSVDFLVYRARNPDPFGEDGQGKGLLKAIGSKYTPPTLK